MDPDSIPLTIEAIPTKRRPKRRLLPPRLAERNPPRPRNLRKVLLPVRQSHRRKNGPKKLALRDFLGSTGCQPVLSETTQESRGVKINSGEPRGHHCATAQGVPGNCNAIGRQNSGANRCSEETGSTNRESERAD